MNYFEQLAGINCSDKVEKKNNLTYLSWAWAWDKLKRLHPTAFYTIYENAEGLFYHTDGRTAWVKTGVTVDVDGAMVEHIEYLPVMDNRNKSIPVNAVTSFDVNKAIQRSLTKAVARHGLGLYIYAGEDLPEGEEKPVSDPAFSRVDSVEVFYCDDCGGVISATKKRDGTMWDPKDMITYSELKFQGKHLCALCMKKESKNA